MDCNKSYRINYGYFYTSMTAYLKHMKDTYLGTIRKYRLPNNKTLNKKNLQVDPREQFYEYLSVYEIIPNSVTSWIDNRSNYYRHIVIYSNSKNTRQKIEKINRS